MPRLPADMMPTRLTGFDPLDPNSITPFERMYHKFKLTPSIVLGKSLYTTQITLPPNIATVVVSATVAKFYIVIPIGTMTDIFIGNKGVTTTSGFRLPAGAPFDFAVTENTELYAVAGIQTTLCVMDMGM